MLPVPEASLPAVEICSDRSVAGAMISMLVTGSWQEGDLQAPCIGSLLTTSATLLMSLMMRLAMT